MNMLLVAAITIGRAYSAYGFSFRHEFRKDPLKITSKNDSVKTATAALFKPDESIHAFGSEAVNKYSELKERNQHHAWYFFNEFKISPISKKEGMVMKDINNKAMAAIGVYSKVVGYLKAELMAIITQGNNRLESSDIHWVLTVPGTWNNDSRHFMKDVAEKVGIPVSQLSLAIEPEAALLYCMHIPMEAHVDNSYTLDASCIPGNSILVMNYEGGSFDTTLFNVRKDNTLRELNNFSKEPNNEIMVTEQFKSMLVKILGSDTMHTFQKDAFSDFDQILREFERKTSTFEYYPHTKLTLTLPFSLLKIYAQKYEENMNTMIDQTEFAGKIRLTGDKLKIETDVLKSMFESSVMHILRKVSELMEQLIYKNIHMIAIVGEFSQSPIFQRILQSSLAEKGLKSFCPQNPNLAVLKGAVIFGHSQRRTKDMSTKCSFSFESTVYKKCVDIFTLHAVAEPSSKNKQLKREKGYFSMNIEHRESIVRVCVPSNVNQITGTPDTRINIEVLNKSGWKEHEFLCDMSVMKDGIHITVELKQNEAEDNVIFPQQKSKASACNQAIQYECFERFLDLLDKIVCGGTSLSQNSVLQTLLILIGMETLTGTDPSRIMTYATALHDFDEPIIISVAIALRLFREAFVVLTTHNISFTDIQFLVGDELTKKQQERLREEIKEWSSGNARAKLTDDLDLHTKAQIVSAQDDWDVCLNPDHGPALWKCIICDAYFCTSCKAAHMRGKKSRRHFLLHISDRNKEKDVLKEIFCEIHQRELDMFCITDEEVLCCMCTMTKKHILHKMEPLETYVERIRSNVGKALTNADTVFPQYDETIVDLNKKLSSAMEMSTENSKIIDNAFEEAYLKLKQNAEKLRSAEKERIYRIKKSIRADIKSTTIQMTDSKSKLLDSRRFLENCKDKELIQKANVHINKLRTIEPPQCKSDVSASRISLSDIQSKLQDNLFSK